jgi:hypothetical protein
MFESSANSMTENRPVGPEKTERPSNPQDLPRSELLEATIARIERELRGSLPLVAEGRPAEV